MPLLSQKMPQNCHETAIKLPFCMPFLFSAPCGSPRDRLLEKRVNCQNDRRNPGAVKMTEGQVTSAYTQHLTIQDVMTIYARFPFGTFFAWRWLRFSMR
jgi:hypothetical protein